MSNLTLFEIKVPVLTTSHAAKATVLLCQYSSVLFTGSKFLFVKVTQNWDYFQLVLLCKKSS